MRLVITERTNADHTNVERLQAIAAEAAEQTGRLDVPESSRRRSWSGCSTAGTPARRLMFCDEARRRAGRS